MGKFGKQDVREWCPSSTGPLLPTMTDSLLAPGREVLSKLYHTGELVEATVLGPSREGDDFVRVMYTRNGCGYENLSAPLSAAQFHLRSPSLMSSASSEETPQPPSLGCTTSPPSCPSLPPGWCEPHQTGNSTGGTSPGILEASIALCFEWAGCLVPRDVLLLFRNIVARAERRVQ